MIFSASDRVFDTLIDTKRKSVSIENNFKIRKEPNKKGLCPLYMFITSTGFKRERVHLDIFVELEKWDEGAQRLITNKNEICDTNLILENIESKMTSIKTVYRLSDLIITPEIALNEYLNKINRVNFIAFAREILKEERNLMEEGSFNRYESLINKLEEYKRHIPFSELNLVWFSKYKNYLANTKGNKKTTINSNISGIKKFLKSAQKHGIKLLFDLDDLKVGSTKGNRNYLNQMELLKCMEYYKSSFITPSHKIILGYFLFACMTGLRISNIQELNRNELLSEDFSIIVSKSKKDKTLTLNENAKKIILECEDLFVTKFADQHINDELKKIMKIIGIIKKVTMHVGRHTFATMFLKLGGKVEMLQMLLGHSSITQTMEYVHIVQSEANKEIFILDKIFD